MLLEESPRSEAEVCETWLRKLPPWKVHLTGVAQLSVHMPHAADRGVLYSTRAERMLFEAWWTTMLERAYLRRGRAALVEARERCTLYRSLMECGDSVRCFMPIGVAEDSSTGRDATLMSLQRFAEIRKTAALAGASLLGVYRKSARGMAVVGIVDLEDERLEQRACARACSATRDAAELLHSDLFRTPAQLFGSALAWLVDDASRDSEWRLDTARLMRRTRAQLSFSADLAWADYERSFPVYPLVGCAGWRAELDPATLRQLSDASCAEPAPSTWPLQFVRYMETLSEPAPGSTATDDLPEPLRPHAYELRRSDSYRSQCRQLLEAWQAKCGALELGLRGACARDRRLEKLCRAGMRRHLSRIFEELFPRQWHLEALLEFNQIRYGCVKFHRLLAEDRALVEHAQRRVPPDRERPDRFYVVRWESACELVGSASVPLIGGYAYLTYLDAERWMLSRFAAAVDVHRMLDAHLYSAFRAERWLLQRASLWDERPASKPRTRAEALCARGSKTSGNAALALRRSELAPALDAWKRRFWRGYPHAGGEGVAPLQGAILTMGPEHRACADNASLLESRLNRHLFGRLADYWTLKMGDSANARRSPEPGQHANERLGSVMQERARFASEHPEEASRDNALVRCGIDIRFARECWDLLPPCVRRVIGGCLQQRRHMRDRERMFVFQFLAHVGVPLQYAQELWYEMCKRSKEASYPGGIERDWVEFAHANNVHGQYPKNLYATRDKIAAARRSRGDAVGFLACSTVVSRNAGWCCGSDLAGSSSGGLDLERAQEACKVMHWKRARSYAARVQAARDPKRSHVTIEYDDGQAWPNRTYWSPASATNARLYYERRLFDGDDLSRFC